MKLENHPRVFVWTVIILSAALIAFSGLWLQSRSLVRACRDESVCWSVIRDLGPEFSSIRVGVSTHPKAFVVGRVGTTAERDRLDRELTRELGGEGRQRIAFEIRIGSE
jgi:hypothetical protein